MSILKDPLVLKYFGKGECSAMRPNCICSHPGCMALRILEAMEAPLRISEKYLYIRGDRVDSFEYIVLENWRDDMLKEIHPWYLRLPDSFQPSPQTKPHNCETTICKCRSCSCGGFLTFHKPDCDLLKPPPSAPKCCDNPYPHEKRSGCYDAVPKLTPETPKPCCERCQFWARDMRKGCSCECHHDHDRKPDEVEQFINKHGYTNCSFDELRELVALVKRTGDAKETKNGL